MWSRIRSPRYGMALAALLPFGIIGCPSTQSTGLPGSVTLELPDGTSVEAEQGSGAASLADSQWQFFRTGASAQSLAFTLQFGPDGELDSFEDNTIAPEIFDDTILFDGQRHSTTQQGLEYAAATFGAETADASGFTFEGKLAAFFAGIKAANGTATATATYVADDPDTVEGNFKFSMEVSFPSIPTIPDDDFPFVGRRVTE